MGSVLIIGGGPAGMAAALAAASCGDEVTLAEKNARLGRKLLATGNGRCNLANVGAPRYYGQADFALKALSMVGARDVLAWFEGLGLAMTTEEDGRVYPACGHGAVVMDVLLAALERAGVRVLCDTRVTALSPRGTRIGAQVGGQDACFDRAVVAGGGMAAPKLGAGPDAYDLLRAQGHAVVSPRPALCRLRVEKGLARELNGVRLPAALRLTDETGQTADSAEGEVLFAERAVSGVCAMQLARAAGDVLARGGTPVVHVDLSPAIGAAPARRTHGEAPLNHELAVRALLRARVARDERTLCGLLPAAAERALRARGGDLARALCDYRLTVTALDGFDGAQVTAGGADTRGFTAHDMRSRLQPMLFAAGEALNVDGDCGGYNLLFAWSSGLLAGRAGR